MSAYSAGPRGGTGTAATLSQGYEGRLQHAGAERGEHQQAVGRSRGGRSTKIHALTDRLCRPIAFLLTGGNVADCEAAKQLLEHLPASRVLHGDKGYDTDAFRRRIEANGTLPNIPPKVNRLWKCCVSPALSSPQCNRDGLITNDKFCLSRFGQLKLNWWRLPLRLRQPELGRCPVSQSISAAGGNDAGLAGASRVAAPLGRTAALGSDLSAAVGLDPRRTTMRRAPGRPRASRTGGEG